MFAQEAAAVASFASAQALAASEAAAEAASASAQTLRRLHEQLAQAGLTSLVGFMPEQRAANCAARTGAPEIPFKASSDRNPLTAVSPDRVQRAPAAACMAGGDQQLAGSGTTSSAESNAANNPVEDQQAMQSGGGSEPGSAAGPAASPGANVATAPAPNASATAPSATCGNNKASGAAASEGGDGRGGIVITPLGASSDGQAGPGDGLPSGAAAPPAGSAQAQGSFAAPADMPSLGSVHAAHPIPSPFAGSSVQLQFTSLADGLAAGNSKPAVSLPPELQAQSSPFQQATSAHQQQSQPYSSVGRYQGPGQMAEPGRHHPPACTVTTGRVGGDGAPPPPPPQRWSVDGAWCSGGGHGGYAGSNGGGYSLMSQRSFSAAPSAMGPPPPHGAPYQHHHQYPHQPAPPAPAQAPNGLLPPPPPPHPQGNIMRRYSEPVYVPAGPASDGAGNGHSNDRPYQELFSDMFAHPVGGNGNAHGVPPAPAPPGQAAHQYAGGSGGAANRPGGGGLGRWPSMATIHEVEMTHGSPLAHAELMEVDAYLHGTGNHGSSVGSGNPALEGFGSVQALDRVPSAAGGNNGGDGRGQGGGGVGGDAVNRVAADGYCAQAQMAGSKRERQGWASEGQEQGGPSFHGHGHANGPAHASHFGAPPPYSVSHYDTNAPRQEHRLYDGVGSGAGSAWHGAPGSRDTAPHGDAVAPYNQHYSHQDHTGSHDNGAGRVNGNGNYNYGSLGYPGRVDTGGYNVGPGIYPESNLGAPHQSLLRHLRQSNNGMSPPGHMVPLDNSGNVGAGGIRPPLDIRTLTHGSAVPAVGGTAAAGMISPDGAGGNGSPNASTQSAASALPNAAADVGGGDGADGSMMALLNAPQPPQQPRRESYGGGGGLARRRSSSGGPMVRNKNSGTSRFRGVTKHRWTQKWEAHLWDSSVARKKTAPGGRTRGKQVYLGGYATEVEAARAYDMAAIVYWGQDATTNFPLEEYREDLEELSRLDKDSVVAMLRRRSTGFSRGASRFRGVTRHHQPGKWEARIGKVSGGRYLYLGTFDSEDAAAMAYDYAAMRRRGPRAITNFDPRIYVHEVTGALLPLECLPEQVRVGLAPGSMAALEAAIANAPAGDDDEEDDEDDGVADGDAGGAGGEDPAAADGGDTGTRRRRPSLAPLAPPQALQPLQLPAGPSLSQLPQLQLSPMGARRPSMPGSDGMEMDWSLAAGADTAGAGGGGGGARGRRVSFASGGRARSVRMSSRSTTTDIGIATLDRNGSMPLGMPLAPAGGSAPPPPPHTAAGAFPGLFTAGHQGPGHVHGPPSSTHSGLGPVMHSLSQLVSTLGNQPPPSNHSGGGPSGPFNGHELRHPTPQQHPPDHHPLAAQYAPHHQLQHNQQPYTHQPYQPSRSPVLLEFHPSSPHLPSHGFNPIGSGADAGGGGGATTGANGGNTLLAAAMRRTATDTGITGGGIAGGVLLNIRQGQVLDEQERRGPVMTPEAAAWGWKTAASGPASTVPTADVSRRLSSGGGAGATSPRQVTTGLQEAFGTRSFRTHSGGGRPDLTAAADGGSFPGYSGGSFGGVGGGIGLSSPFRDAFLNMSSGGSAAREGAAAAAGRDGSGGGFGGSLGAASPRQEDAQGPAKYPRLEYAGASPGGPVQTPTHVPYPSLEIRPLSELALPGAAQPAPGELAGKESIGYTSGMDNRNATWARDRPGPTAEATAASGPANATALQLPLPPAASTNAGLGVQPPEATWGSGTRNIASHSI